MKTPLPNAQNSVFVTYGDRSLTTTTACLTLMSACLLYNHCIHTKRGLEEAYATFHVQVVTSKNRLDKRVHAPVRKL